MRMNIVEIIISGNVDSKTKIKEIKDDANSV